MAKPLGHGGSTILFSLAWRREDQARSAFSRTMAAIEAGARGTPSWEVDAPVRESARSMALNAGMAGDPDSAIRLDTVGRGLQDYSRSLSANMCI